MALLHIRTLWALAATLMVAACVKPDLHLETQKVTVRTLGAQNAKCYLHNDEYRYVAYTDQTITVSRTAEDMMVTCMAEGNREQSIVVPHTFFDERARANALPDEIIVSFIGQAAKPFALPQYHDKATRRYPLPVESEYMGPSVVAEESEPFQEPDMIEKRVYESSNPFEGSAKASPRDSYDPREEDK